MAERRVAKAPLSEYTLTPEELYLFAKGDYLMCADKLGAHVSEEGCTFSVWAPGVLRVAVTGSFLNWDSEGVELLPTKNGGVWQGYVEGVKAGDVYKFVITDDTGETFQKADPYAFYSERPSAYATASIVADLSTITWSEEDAVWMAKRQKENFFERPMNIYEVHLGSWRRHALTEEEREEIIARGEEPEDRYYSYLDDAEELVKYVSDMGYTHVELLPVTEHPFDGSWGYQTTGYFAPTARFGTPAEFAYLVDRFHAAGIGVISDWVPGHFCRDAHGLRAFNGHDLYEFLDHEEWGTYKFDFSRGEVRSFLISSALFWLNKYHIDGIRVDGVTSMLYLNFGITDETKWMRNAEGTFTDLEAIKFLKTLNDYVHERFPGVMMIAEESTSWPKITAPTQYEGLGFDFKWDMGWMNDTLRYLEKDYVYRPWHQEQLTFSTMYAFSEKFILPLSHDEVVHGKKSIIGRSPGDYWRQFADIRTLAFYQMTHTGGKLNFMGNEIAQYIEWRYYEGLEFKLVDQFETHRKHQEFWRALNHLYLETPELWECSYDGTGFEWIDADNTSQCILSYVRKGKKGRKKFAPEVIVVLNMTPETHFDFRLGVPRAGAYREVFNTDKVEFGGSGQENKGNRYGRLYTEAVPMHGQEQSLVITVPPLAGIMLKRCAR